MEPRYIVAIEIGSSKIKGAVGTVESDGTLSVIAVEEEKRVNCVRYGCIQNVDEVSFCVSKIIRCLQNRIYPRQIRGVYAGIGGRSLLSAVREAERQLADEMEITERIIEQIKSEANTTLTDRNVVSVEPMEFIVDNQTIINPVGTFGQNIRATLNVITCKPQIIKNINRVLVEKLQLHVCGYIVRQLAEADLVLTEDEKRLGCMFVDMGAETTTVSIYKNGSLQYLSTLPLGSRNITRDITALNYIEERAEEIKKAVGNANPSETSASSIAAEGIDTTEINNYVQARAGEIMANITEQLNYAGLKASEIPGGIVMIGGGSKLRGFSTLLANQTKLKVRQGLAPSGVRISDSGIKADEAVDVIAILAAAARMAPAECVFTPERHEDENDEPEEDIHNQNTAGDNKSKKRRHDDDDDDDEYEDERPRRGGSFWGNLRTRVENLINGNEDDDFFDDDEK